MMIPDKTSAPLPPVPAGPGGRPLPEYILIALWALSLGRPVNRTDIARAFGKSERQAADLMLYMEAAGQGVIVAGRFLAPGPSGRLCAWLQVTAVHTERYRPHRAGRPRKASGTPEQQHLDAMRDLFLRRPVAGRQS